MSACNLLLRRLYKRTHAFSRENPLKKSRKKKSFWIVQNNTNFVRLGTEKMFLFCKCIQYIRQTHSSYVVLFEWRFPRSPSLPTNFPGNFPFWSQRPYPFVSIQLPRKVYQGLFENGFALFPIGSCWMSWVCFPPRIWCYSEFRKDIISQ